MTPVDNTTPYETLSRIDLPKNLHVQQEYHRFHPGETCRICRIIAIKNKLLYIYDIFVQVYKWQYFFFIDTDTLFSGKTAFPKSSTFVTGIKYKKKYPGHMQENPWLDEQIKI